jgi:hypothetical protein
MIKDGENQKKILAIFLVIAVLILGIYKLFFEKEMNDEEIDTTKIFLLEDNNRFFTVSACVSKYINYLSIKDTNNLLILLSDVYKQKKSINSENIYENIGMVNGTNTFVGKKIFEQRLSKSLYKYYVYGTIQEELMDSTSPKSNYYLIVILDEDNMTFSIEPYDGEMFK